ncbi:hypothetical protein TcasGA2_TC013387 [Tribolium castaneum]|uniref:Uncharacterized protein n=1 Tax=Tribolium castaneum TaxID=7070 RepID=D6WLU2_TRICA|nr:hypothetical protein TcasGA2_TC013387 [Tribolium castaneum]
MGRDVIGGFGMISSKYTCKQAFDNSRVTAFLNHQSWRKTARNPVFRKADDDDFRKTK